jgi:hypothetical protein
MRREADPRTPSLTMRLVVTLALLVALSGCAPGARPLAPSPEAIEVNESAAEAGAARAGDDAAGDRIAGDEPRDAPPEPAPSAGPIITPFDGVVVRTAERVVEVEAVVVLQLGWLEQVVCSAGTREHESLLVPRASPSQLHAALLMAGFVPGRPGRWTRASDGALVLEPPEGDPLEIHVRFTGPDGTTVVEPIRSWIREAGEDGIPFPGDPWIFCGSVVEPNPEWMGPGQHYLADITGSVVGLVTFGDEVIGFAQVIADREEVRVREWEAVPGRVPEPGTLVWLLIEPYDAPNDLSAPPP